MRGNPTAKMWGFSRVGMRNFALAQRAEDAIPPSLEWIALSRGAGPQLLQPCFEKIPGCLSLSHSDRLSSCVGSCICGDLRRMK
jgi:hypothetical protein